MQAVPDLRSAATEQEGRLSRQGELGAHGGVVADLGCHVLRLDIRALHVDDVVMLAEADDIFRRLERAGPLAVIEIGNMGWTAD